MRRLGVILGLGLGLNLAGACDQTGEGRGSQGGGSASLCADAIAHTQLCIQDYCTGAGSADPMCSNITSEPKRDATTGCGEFQTRLAAETLEQSCEDLVGALRAGKNDDSLQTCVGLEESVDFGGASIDLGNLICAGQGEDGFEVCVLGNLFCPVKNDPPEVRCENAEGTCSTNESCSGGRTALDDVDCGDGLACCVETKCSDITIDGTTALCQQGFQCSDGFSPASGSCGDGAVCCIQQSCSSAGGFCLPADKEEAAGCGDGMTKGFGYGGCDTGTVCCVPGTSPTPPDADETDEDEG